MAATYERRSSIAPMPSHPLLVSQTEVSATHANDGRLKQMLKRRASVDNGSLSANGLSSPPVASEGRQSSWWHTLASALTVKNRLRRKSSSAAQSGDSFRGELQWFGAPVATASTVENGQTVVFSSLCFDDSGELLASGDKRGNVVVLQHDNDKSPSSMKSAGGCNQLNYKVYRTFQSHTSEYDYQKTANVDPTIVKIRWLKRSSPSRFLLAANERSIKLWKLNEHRNEIMSNAAAANFKDCMNSRDLRLPVVTAIDSPSVSATLRRMFTNGHEYGINSVSVNSDQQTFLSADDLRINVWNMEVADETYNVVDLKPPGATELTELTTIITSAEFHPDECHMFAYSTNTGLLRLCDMRQQALCDQHAKLFQNQNSESSTGVLSDIIKSISDVKFCRTSGPYLLTRDYLTLKVWDVRCDGQGPCETYAVHPYLSGRLSFLYENDCIMDRFECDWGYNDRVLSGGSYHDLVHMFDRVAKSDINLRVSSALDSPPSSSSSSSSSSNDNQHVVPLKSCQVLVSGTFRKKKDEVNVEKLNYTHKMKNIAWHPSECIMAVASGSRIYGMLGKDLSL